MVTRTLGMVPRKVHRLALTVVAIMVGSLGTSDASEIICASTTSTENTGLFRYLLPIFEKETGIEVKVVARGTGAAIEMGIRGDADVAFVHAKEQELDAVEKGFFVNRRDVMYNDFVIVGPEDDPAQIVEIKSAALAFRRIAEKARFVSRGDDSGTNTKERAIWRETGMDPKGESWYLEAGQGMEKTQRVANEKRAYTLTDRGTWLATKDRDRLELKIVLEGDPVLFNQYGVMAVNPERFSHVKYKEATVFIDWLTSKEGQEAIGSFTDEKGNVLFVPNAQDEDR